MISTAVTIIRTIEGRRFGREFVVLVLWSFVVMVLNLLSVSSILPFMRMLSAPESLLEFGQAVRLQKALGIEEISRFLMLLGIGVLGLFLAANTLTGVIQWKIVRFVERFTVSLCSQLFDTYMFRPYRFYLDRNTSDLTKNLFSEANRFSGQVVRPFIDIMVDGLWVVSIVVLLVIAEPIVAIIGGAVLVSSYLLIYLASHSRSVRAAKRQAKMNRRRFQLTNDTFGAIKEVKFYGLEDTLRTAFRSAVAKFERTRATIQIIAQTPKYVLENIVFGSLVAVALILFVQDRKSETILPLMTMYLAAGYKLLPSFQRLYAGATKLRSGRVTTGIIASDLILESESLRRKERHPLAFRDRITFDDVSFTYVEGGPPALTSATFEIKKDSSVGIVGPSGGGKTTLVDLLMGLLHPSSGGISVDGAPLDPDNAHNWQANCGYVPQQVVLVDASIEQNIAFGDDEKTIDRTAVERAARLAHIHDFIVSTERGYDTMVGERGVRLSGGQRQRIGIARALYRDPDVLVFDEATSALDEDTQRSVIEAIKDLHGQKTLVVVSHRLSILEFVDRVFRVDAGSVTEERATVDS